jgi:hypothetical protein
MFELFLAPVCTADLTKQVHRRETVGLTRLPARFMPFILRAFSLFVSPLVAGNLAQALTATPTRVTPVSRQQLRDAARARKTSSARRV